MSDAAALTVHATTVAIDGRAVMLTGRSGAGKSDLALRLIDRGARLVADDYTNIARDGDTLTASAPATIAGQFEIRGIGIVAMPHAPAPVALLCDLEQAPDRLPEPCCRDVAGVALPLCAVAAFEASAAIKVEWALRQVPR